MAHFLLLGLFVSLFQRVKDTYQYIIFEAKKSMSEDKLEHSCTRLNDLSNEILMIIFKYLHHHHVLYSFININKRFDTIINDTIIGKKLTLISFNDSSCPFNDTIFDRFCSQILPSIHHKIRMD
jgi:hypothetical protein